MTGIPRVELFHGSHVVTETTNPVPGVNTTHDGPLVRRDPRPETTLRHVWILQNGHVQPVSVVYTSVNKFFVNKSTSQVHFIYQIQLVVRPWGAGCGLYYCAAR